MEMKRDLVFGTFISWAFAVALTILVAIANLSKLNLIGVALVFVVLWAIIFAVVLLFMAIIWVYQRLYE